MRKNNNKRHVRQITTGHIEADMLGQTMIISEEIRNKQRSSQRPHRNGMKQSISEMYIRGKLKGLLKWFQTAPTACWRRLKAWQDKKDASVPRYLQGVRKNKRNGN